MIFAHISDVHIKNLKNHKNYRIIFEELYKSLRNNKVDYIVVCGDLCHSKTTISPEYVDLASNFLSNLANIANTYIILGNHDFSVKNSSRQDAITPIVEALNHPNLCLMKESQEVLLGNDFALNVLSLFGDKWVEPSSLERVNIALYHGAIRGCLTDSGFKMDHGDHDLAIFKSFDYAMLGDIHKTDQAIDNEGRVRYSGSLIQQNHGEDNDKGYLLWDIKDKDTFKVKHVKLNNPIPFVTIELTSKGKIPKNVNIPIGARVRLVTEGNIPFDAMRRVIDIAKQRFKPEAITFLNRAAYNCDLTELTSDIIQEDLRDSAVQEELIEQFLKPYEIDDNEVLHKVISLNRKYNSFLEQREDVARNVNWKLKKLKWNNLFNYGEGNQIDFSKLRGIVGIFGKNFSGKSSIIDSLLYTIYNTTSKNERKNINIINQNKDYGDGFVEIEIGDKTYTIKRCSEKYEKTLHGKTTIEAKTTVDFNRSSAADEENLNGDTRPDTDKAIRKIFGQIDDFFLTSMSSQFGSLAYINEGSTRRKEILARFLDLEIFEQKFKLAKEDAADIKGALKLLENRDFDEEINTSKQLLVINRKAYSDRNAECLEIKKIVDEKKEEIDKLNEAIRSIPAEIIDIEEISSTLTQKQNALNELAEENKKITNEIWRKNERFVNIGEFLNTTFNVEEYQLKREKIRDNKERIRELGRDLEIKKTGLSETKKRTKLLKEVPCGDEYPGCKLLKNAHEAVTDVLEFQADIAQIERALEQANKLLNDMEPQKVDEYLSKHNKLVSKQQELSADIAERKLTKQKNRNVILKLRQEIKELKRTYKKYEDNKDVIENLEYIVSQKEALEVELKDLSKQTEKCEKEILKLVKVLGSSEQQLNDLKEQKNELQKLRSEYEAYDLFLRCMHSDGISYDIIKKRLPVINSEISKVLANVVDFEVFFENHGKKLDIFIKHPKFDSRPLEMGSGAEKAISAMAIRLALLGVSSLPKPSLFILDEPGTSLDEEMMEGFTRIMEIIKSYFKTVILISHLAELKDVVDQQLIIEKTDDGYALVNQ